MARTGVLVTNAAEVLTMSAAHGEGPLGRIARGAVVIEGERVAWVGPARQVPRAYRRHRTLDARGGAVTPGLVDPHTHLIFGGNRAAEFALRAAGAGYEAIHAAGGGIFSTVAATRAASDAALLRAAEARVDRMLGFGVVACEAKTGYELTVKGELRALRLLGALARRRPLRLSPTLLAHAVDRDAGDRDAFVRDFADKLVPEAAARKLARSVDVFVDRGAFSRDEGAAILGAAVRAGLGVRVHAEQLTHTGAAELSAEVSAWSADHLEQVTPAGMTAMARAGVVGVLLPGAALQLRLPAPPARAMAQAGVRLALGTDLNPGSSHSENLPLQMWLGTTWLGLTVPEAWLGVTTHAAAAAFGDARERPDGLPDRPTARLAPGHLADLVIWQTPDHRDLPYHYGVPLASAVVVGGKLARKAASNAA